MENCKVDMLCGEIEQTNIKLTNSGNSALKSLYMVTSSPRLISLSGSFVAAEKVVSDPVLDSSLLDPDALDKRNNHYRVS